MEVRLSIILLNSLSGVVYGLQQGSGSNYTTIQRQNGGEPELRFELIAEGKLTADGDLNFLGHFCHGTPKERFIYLDIGTYSSITDSVSGGRLKIPLYGMRKDLIRAVMQGSALQTKISAIGKNGRPAYGTVKPFGGWEIQQ